jgi:hypothetical protein
MLSYLFTCHFKDGTVIQQTAEDVSKVDPTRSAFYDVVQRLEEVKTFTIIKQDARQHTFMVDLRNGHFEIDGVQFYASAKGELPDEAKFRLIYFHRHQHKIVQGQTMSGDDIQYFIGWQTNLLNGNNVQQTISVK